ncbi:unnamed protein product [Trichobilharzia regenti]|nr:unnamed protein product [Trichobilharzia regenti]
MISPEPEITVVDRDKDLDEIIVLACDGIWDVLTNEELCSLLQNRMRCVEDLSMICNETIDMCLYKCMAFVISRNHTKDHLFVDTTA